MQSVGGQQEQRGMSDVDQAMSLPMSHVPSRVPTCRPSAEPDDPTRDQICDCVRATQYHGRTIEHTT